jgi:acyl dehydratase
MTDGKQLFFEDFPEGARLEFGHYPVTKEEIIAFAKAYDPQPFHLDEDAAARSMLGGLAASGWHTCAIAMRLVCDGFLNITDGRGAPGIDEVKWLKPVRPGMILSMYADVISSRVSQSRPSIGLVQFRFTTKDQTGTIVMEQNNFVMMGRRGSKQEPHGGIKPQGTTPLLPFDEAQNIPAFADLEPGQRIVLGSIAFTQDSVLDFANRYDPQPFHTDLAAAEIGPFGGLAASGWHTAASWMRCFVDAARRSGAAVQAGPSPGFTKLRWLKPVYAGDTISYDTRLIEKRLTSRPGWGLVKSKNSGINQYGVTVFEFESVSFWKVT